MILDLLILYVCEFVGCCMQQVSEVLNSCIRKIGLRSDAGLMATQYSNL